MRPLDFLCIDLGPYVFVGPVFFVIEQFASFLFGVREQ